MWDFKRYGKNQWRIYLRYAMMIFLSLLLIAGLLAGFFVAFLSDGNAVTKLKERNSVVEEPVQDNSGQEQEQEVEAKVLMTEMTSVESYNILPVAGANATSTISQEGVSNNPILMFDGRDDTNWQEGVPGLGSGESVSFSFDKSYQVKYINFKLGNWKNDEYYHGNARPRNISIALGDIVRDITFTGERRPEWVEFSEEVPADSMRITLHDSFRGTQWEDTCITEIAVYGR